MTDSQRASSWLRKLKHRGMRSFDQDHTESKWWGSELNQGGPLCYEEQVSPLSFLNPELALLRVNKSKNYSTFQLPKSTSSPDYLGEFLDRTPRQRLKY